MSLSVCWPYWTEPPPIVVVCNRYILTFLPCTYLQNKGVKHRQINKGEHDLTSFIFDIEYNEQCTCNESLSLEKHSIIMWHNYVVLVK